MISERLGHESPAFTLKQYAHVIPGMQAEAAQAVAKLVAGRGGVGHRTTVPERASDHNPRSKEKAPTCNAGLTCCGILSVWGH